MRKTKGTLLVRIEEGVMMLPACTAEDGVAGDQDILC